MQLNNKSDVVGKVCSQCKLYKSYINSSRTRKVKDGYRSACKECLNKKNQDIANNRIITNMTHLKCADCKENKLISEFNKDKFKSTGYRTRCRNCDKNYKKLYYQKNSCRLIKEKTQYLNNNPIKRIAHNLRVRISKIIRIVYKLNSINKAGSAVRDLGCTIPEFKKHIESKFQSGMTWDNHGQYGWHVDHIKPLSIFDLTDRRQFLEACHFTNLQPLWAYDNLRKCNRVS